jgi:16S rRNA processing protein RimM
MVDDPVAGDRVVVGRVGRPHGVKGEVTVDVRTDVPERRFAPGARFERGAARPPLVVAACRWHSGRLLVRFEGVVDRTGAEAVRGTVLTIDASVTGPAGDDDTDDDTWWDRDLVGLRAATTDGVTLGTVADVVHSPAGDILAITRPGGGEHLVPFVREIVPEVDVAGGRLVVDPPPGLLELD